MNLTEHQAKKILHGAGIKVPSGEVVTTAEHAVAAAEKLGSPPWVIKAQIPAGGRAQGHFKGDTQAKGGVRIARSLEQVQSSAQQMLEQTLITQQTGSVGFVVKHVYVEHYCTVEHEMYLALTIDRTSGSAAFIAARHGGTNIERLAEQAPDSIISCPVDIDSHSLPGEIAARLELSGESREQLLVIMASMLSLFVERDATLIELNPLGIDAVGQLVALDATIVLDDNALFRQGHEEQMVAYDHLPAGEFEAASLGLNYVKLNGNIGSLAAGAGLAMATLDAIKESGGQPANFLEVPPSATVPLIQAALEILLADPDIDGILVNIFGGGIMRCDAVADALLLAHQRNPRSIPVIVRLAGTNATLAMQRLASSLPAVIIASDLSNAAESVVNLVQGKIEARAAKQRREQQKWWQRMQSVIHKSRV